MKIDVTNYTFNKAAKTVTFTDYASIVLEKVLIITNVTSNVIIYNFADPLKGGTAATNVLTLTYDTTAMADTDRLQIFYDDPNYDIAKGQALAAASMPVVLTAAQLSTLTPNAAITNYSLETGGNLASVKTNTDKIPSLGQALAASSVPVVLTAIQLATLTPPGAITNYALETGGNLATLAGAVTSSVVQSNVKQINGVTTLMGNGTTGTGSQRVTIASDNTPFPVKTDQTTHGTTDLVAADITKVGGSAVTLGQKTAANSFPVVLASDNIITIGAVTSAQSATTTGNITGNAQAITINVTGYSTVGVSLGGTYSGINVSFLASKDGGVTYPYVIQAKRDDSYTVETTSGSLSNTTRAWTIPIGGYTHFEVLSTAYSSGTGAVTIIATGDNLSLMPSVGLASIMGNIILTGNGATGNGSQRVTIASDNTPFPIKIDQTTPGTTNAFSLAQIGATTIVNGGTAGSQSVGGIVANNGTINSAVNPILVGGQAVSSENAAGTTAKLGQFVTDLVGKQIVLPYANPENFVSGAITSAMTGTTSTSLIAAPASGLRNYITHIVISNAHATVGTDLIIQDGSGGTTLYTIPAAAVYGGSSITLPVPIRQPTTATAIYCANVTTGASTKVSASGYKGI